jgi:hypothetical protein
MSTDLIKWPFGDASYELIDSPGAKEISIKNDLTIIEVSDVEGNIALDLDIGDDVEDGAIIAIVVDGLNNGLISPGAGFLRSQGFGGPTIEVEGSMQFVFVKNGFVQIGAKLEVELY